MITVEKSGIVAEEVKRRAGNRVISDMSYKEWENWKKGFENADKDGIIRLEDIVIGRSIGAKAKNYDIQLPNREIVHLTEGTKITQVQVIAGKGRNRQIDEIDGLLIKYPQTKETEWKKRKRFRIC